MSAPEKYKLLLLSSEESLNYNRHCCTDKFNITAYFAL